jgi:hypothetical protein
VQAPCSARTGARPTPWGRSQAGVSPQTGRASKGASQARGRHRAPAPPLG